MVQQQVTPPLCLPTSCTSYVLGFSEHDRYHAMYVKEVKRLFDTYKGRVVDYKDKELLVDM